MVLEEYITDKGHPLMFGDEKSRCLGEIKIGFDRTFGATYAWVVEESSQVPQIVVIDHKPRTRTETDGCSITNTSRALLRPGRALEQVKLKKTTTEKFYAYIRYDFGMVAWWRPTHIFNG
jgi:hypothetical protein